VSRKVRMLSHFRCQKQDSANSLYKKGPIGALFICNRIVWNNPCHVRQILSLRVLMPKLTPNH